MSQSDAGNKVLGIDLGSRTVKLCLMENGMVISRKIFDSIYFYKEMCSKNETGFSINLDLPEYKTTRMVATGYGRMSAAIAGAESISELKAHFLGALFQTGLSDFTLLDIGGQDYKVIKVMEGKMTDMATNDKCAASTGRYIENMARVLGISVEEMGKYSENPVELSTTCAIFGESEIIGLIVKGEPLNRLAAGVNKTTAERVAPLLNRMSGDIILMSGGVSLNQAVVKFISENTGKKVVVLDDPVYNGAIGCCLFKRNLDY
jgi:(R)-2-hydroxyacyl-CoA dehydratese activating ATPase